MLAEHSCLVVSNLCLSDRLCVPLLLSLEAHQNLLNLALTSTDCLQEAALQALYNLLRTEKIFQDLSRQLVVASLSKSGHYDRNDSSSEGSLDGEDGG